MCLSPMRSWVRCRGLRRRLPKTGCHEVGLRVVPVVGRGCLVEAGSLLIVKCASGELHCDRLRIP